MRNNTPYSDGPSTATDRLPPNNLTAEQGVLCAAMNDTAFLDHLLDQVPEPSFLFYDLRHVTIYNVLANLRREGMPTDVSAVTIQLMNTGQIDSVSGPSYISGLNDLMVPSSGPYYLQTALDFASRRRIIAACSKSILHLYDLSSPDALSIADDLLDQRKIPPGRKALPAIEDASTLIQEKMVYPVELVHGILHAGTKMVIGGGSKSNKTWLLMDLAIAVSHRGTWLSAKTNPGKVLYINFEIDRRFFVQRIRNIAHAKHIDLQPGLLDIWNLRGKSASHDVLIPLILKRIRSHNYALIIIDPYYKLLGNLDENAAGDMSKLMNSFEDIIQTTGSTVVIGAHFSKGNQSQKESIDRISGSGVFARDPDTIMVMTKHEDDGAFTIETTLRNFKPIEPFVIKWDYPIFRRADELDPSDLKKAPGEGRPKKYSTDSILEILSDQSLSVSEWRDQCLEKLKIASSTFYVLKQKAVKTRRIIEKEGLYSLSEN